jgi:energy-converting hydrogenase Eha subunit F
LGLLSDASILLFYFLIYSWIVFGSDCIVVMKDTLFLHKNII